MSEVTILADGSRDEWEMVDRVIDKVKCKVEGGKAGPKGIILEFVLKNSKVQENYFVK